MKILLFNPMIKLFYKPMTSPLGLMSIASYLNANGHNAIICDRFYNNKDINSVIDEFAPDIIGVSVITNRFIEDALNISRIAKNKKIPVVWGGPLTTEIPLDILKSEVVDFISLNEGEETWLEIADALSEGKNFYNIKGLAYLKENHLVITESREFVNLANLSPIDWSLIDVEKYFQPYYQSKRMLYMYSSKGCIGNCTFCYNSQFHHSKHRKRSNEHLFKEIKYLVENHNMDGVNFSDDLMFCNKNQAIDFCNEIIENNINIYWGGNLRVGIINDLEDFKLMHKAGCRWLLIGVETGSQKMQQFISKKIPFDKIVKTFDMCSEVGIVAIAPFMIGLPGETTEDLKETVDLAKKLKATVCVFNYYTPIPGSKMYDDLLKEKKYIAPKNLSEHSSLFFGEKLVCNLSQVTSTELKVIWNYFQLRSLLFRNEFKDSSGEKMLFVKIIKNAIKSIAGHGFIHFLKAGFSGFTDMVGILRIFFHPKIRSRYNLYFTK